MAVARINRGIIAFLSYTPKPGGRARLSGIIRVEKLTKKFGDFTANDGIDFEVQKGEIRAIIGENGAGKTTLMNMLYCSRPLDKFSSRMYR